MRVLHTVASVAPAGGGPSRTVPALVGALRDLGIEARLHVADRDGPRPDVAGVDLVHDHGVWLPANHRAAVEARRAGVPRVVSPRGMLAPRALAHRGWKKRVAWALYQRADLRGAALVHATSAAEAADARRLGLGPVAVVPNGVRPPEPLPERRRGTARRALFLGRLHPIKGVPMLVEAWARVRPGGWGLDVAGPDEGGHRAELERLVAERGLGARVAFLGEAGEAAKWALLRSADLVVLPTRTENFGVVVAEALAAGVPALTTTGAPWGALRDERCGWWVEPSASGLEAGLREATALDRAALDAMGERGRAYAARAFGWPALAARTAAVYRWLLEGGPRPPDVEGRGASRPGL